MELTNLGYISDQEGIQIDQTHNDLNLSTSITEALNEQSPVLLTELSNVFQTPFQKTDNQLEISCKTNISSAKENDNTETFFGEEESLYEPSSFSKKEFCSEKSSMENSKIQTLETLGGSVEDHTKEKSYLLVDENVEIIIEEGHTGCTGYPTSSKTDGNVLYCPSLSIASDNMLRRSCKADISYAEENDDTDNLLGEEESPYEPSSSSSRAFSSEMSSMEHSKIQTLEDSVDSQTKEKSDLLVDENFDVIAEQQPSDIKVPNSSQICENILHCPSLQIASVLSSDKRKWDKKFCCPFCQITVSKLPRHMFNCHSKEREIAFIMSLNKNTKERKTLLQELQNRGTFIRNKKIIKEGEGLIIPKRRLHGELRKKLEDYSPCTHCFQMFSKTYLHRHVKKCSFIQTKTDSVIKRNRSLIANSVLMLPIGQTVSNRFKTCILSKMMDDEVFKIIRSDQLILLFGEAEFKRLGHDERYHRNITDRCRELGRLVQSAKNVNKNIYSLKDLISPSNYKLFRDAVFNVAGFNPKSNHFKTPSLALKIGYTIKKCISILKGEYLEDDVLRTEIPNLNIFNQILDSKWHIEVSSHAHRTLAERKWNAPKRIPLTKDIQILHKYLCSERDIYFTKLSELPSSEAFQKLTEVTLVLVIMLNRRRVGDVQYTPLVDYQKAKGVDSESDVFNTLSDSEKQLAKCFQRLVIRGKRGRGVPILLTNEIQECINLLITRRAVCGVDSNNMYLFASLRNTCGFYRASDLISTFARKAGCELAETITSTRLRKHVSTMVQLLNLKDHELDALAQFLGHDIRVHRKHYRLQDETIQLAKISKILVNFSNGKLNTMKGKSLDEIEVSDFSEESDQENQESEDNNPSSEKTVDEKIRIKTPNNKHQKKGKERKQVVKHKWSTEEANIVLKEFRQVLITKKLPGKLDIDQCIKNNKTILQNRSWRNIKDFLYGKLKKM